MARRAPPAPQRSRRTSPGGPPVTEANGQSNVRRSLVETEILERSAKLFAERGFAATTVQDIAETIGVSRSAFYHYFSSKEHILERLTESLIQSTTAALAALPRNAPPAERLVDLVRALTGPIAESPNRFRMLLTRDASMSEASRARLHDLEHEVVRSMSEVIDRGMSLGHFRQGDPRVQTFAVIGMINWIAWWYVPEREPSIELITAGIAAQALASLRAPGGDAIGKTSAHEVIAAIKQDLDHLERLTQPPQ
jgi:AcrR family transcriptional regulator